MAFVLNINRTRNEHEGLVIDMQKYYIDTIRLKEYSIYNRVKMRRWQIPCKNKPFITQRIVAWCYLKSNPEITVNMFDGQYPRTLSLIGIYLFSCHNAHVSNSSLTFQATKNRLQEVSINSRVIKNHSSVFLWH